jgi:hypothetical protein
MRLLLLAIALVLTGVIALPGPADARKGYRQYGAPRYYHPQPRYYQPRSYYAPPRYYSREQAICEENAQAEDPAGVYAGYPCWARSAFGRGSGSRR